MQLGNIRGALDTYHHALDLATALGLYTELTVQCTGTFIHTLRVAELRDARDMPIVVARDGNSVCFSGGIHTYAVCAALVKRYLC